MMDSELKNLHICLDTLRVECQECDLGKYGYCSEWRKIIFGNLEHLKGKNFNDQDREDIIGNIYVATLDGYKKSFGNVTFRDEEFTSASISAAELLRKINDLLPDAEEVNRIINSYIPDIDKLNDLLLLDSLEVLVEKTFHKIDSIRSIMALTETSDTEQKEDNEEDDQDEEDVGEIVAVEKHNAAEKKRLEALKKKRRKNRLLLQEIITDCPNFYNQAENHGARFGSWVKKIFFVKRAVHLKGKYTQVLKFTRSKEDNITNITGLMQRLKKSASDPVKYVFKRFSAETQSFIMSYSDDKNLRKKANQLIKKELNRLLDDKYFYDVSIFSSFIEGDLKAFAENKSRTNIENRNLNKILIESVLPEVQFRTSWREIPDDIAEIERKQILRENDEKMLSIDDSVPVDFGNFESDHEKSDDEDIEESDTVFHKDSPLQELSGTTEDDYRFWRTLTKVKEQWLRDGDPGCIKYVNITDRIQFGYAEFREEDFNETLKIETLFNILKRDGFPIKGANIAALNSLLEQSDLYDKLLAKAKHSGKTLSDKQLECYENYYKCKSKRTLKMLNRVALEDFYPLETPKSRREKLKDIAAELGEKPNTLTKELGRSEKKLLKQCLSEMKKLDGIA